MRTLSKLFFRGLAAILPLALTGYLLYWAVSAGERALREIIQALFPDLRYYPGMGFAASIVLVMAVGLLTYSFIVRQVYGRITRLLERIPIVKSIYGMVEDVVRIFASTEEKAFRRVVMVRLQDGSEILGFVTRERFDDLPEGIGAKQQVAVYLPMSYQLGGFTVVVDRSKVREVEMPIEEALRFAVTAGVSGSKAAGPPGTSSRE